MTDELITPQEEPVVQYAKQDAPWPEDKLPKGTAVIGDESAKNIIKYAHLRPGTHTLGDTVLSLTQDVSERHARLIVNALWRGIKPGATLFVSPKFPAQPDAPAKRAHLEGYKQYTK